MKNKPLNWFNKPTRLQLFIIVLVWTISMSMLLLGVTDLFRKPIPLNILLLSVIPSTIVLLTVIINYIKNKKE